MNRLKKILRLFCLVFFMTLASIGLGVPVSFNSREKYLNSQARIEQVETRGDHEDLVEVDEQNT